MVVGERAGGRLRGGFRLILCLGLVSSCGIPGPSPLSSSATGTLPAASATTPAPSPTSSVAAGLYPIVTLPQARLHSALLPGGVQIHRMSTDGVTVAFDEDGYGGDAGQGRKIWLADLDTGVIRVAADSEGGDAAWVPTVSGRNVAWVEWRYADNTALTGVLSWRIRILDLDTGRIRTEVTGTSARLEEGGGVPPLVALDGDHVVYTVESPTAAAPLSWTVVVRSLATDAIIARLPTELSIYQMAASDGAVAYTEGKVDPQGGFKYATRLMLWRGSGPATLVAPDAFELGMGGGVLDWIADPASSQQQVGLATHPRAWALLLAGGSPVPVSAPPDDVIERGAAWPSAGEGIAAWSDMQDGVDPSPRRLAIWVSKLTATFQIEPTSGAILTGVGSGRLVWYDDHDDANRRLFWIGLADLALQ